jgi:hypothetical protein
VSSLAANNPSLLLHTVENLAEFHREHEKFYAATPREQAVELQGHAGRLHALADRWCQPVPLPVTTLHAPDEPDDPDEADEPEQPDDADEADELEEPPGPATDEPPPLRVEGVLLLINEGDAAELERIERELRQIGEESLATGEWMTKAMATAWQAAAALLDIGALADLLGERHRVIANDWQAAALTTVVGHLLDRAAGILARLDPTPAGVRADHAAGGHGAELLHAAAELITRAADLLSETAGLVHDNERRWRLFHDRVTRLLAEQPPVSAPRAAEPSA